MHSPGSSPALGPAAAEEPLKTVRGGCLTSSGHQPSLLFMSRRLVNAWPKRVRPVLTVQAEDDIIAQIYTSMIGSAVSDSRSPSSGRWTSIPRILMHGWIFPTRGTKYPIPQFGICSINILVGPCARSSVMGR